MIKVICCEFNVDYIWLTRGTGEMFVNSDTPDSIAGLVDRIMTGDNEFHKNCLKFVANFTEEDLTAVKRMISYWNELQS